MVDPKIMCDQHLLGEHVELHMIAGSLQKGKRLDGYVRNNLLEFRSIISRHNTLVKEMESRGMKHNSSLPQISSQISNFQSDQVRESIVDVSLSLSDLLQRCLKCSERKQAQITPDYTIVDQNV